MNSPLVPPIARLLLIAGLLFAASAGGRADVLELKNGTVLNGRFEGGTAGTIRFSTDAGFQVLATNELVALTFTGSQPSTAAAVSAVATAAQTPVAPPPPAAPRTVTIPAGTTFTVRMMDTISSNNTAGALFTTRLETNLTASGATAIPAGATVYGKVTASTQERRIAGRSSLEIALTEISVGGVSVPIVTGNYKEVAQTSGLGSAARGAAAGAAVGGLVDGHDGAQNGAAYGAAAGVLKKGQVITIPPGTALQFSLMQPVTVTVATR